MQSRFWLLITAIFLATTYPSLGLAMSSANYEIRFGAIGSGGGNVGSSATYQLRDSVGAPGGLGGVSTNYAMHGGFRGGIYDPLVAFEVFAQNRASQVAVTVLSGTTVTLSSVNGMSAGQKLLIVQNQGASQHSALGEITGIAGNDVTIDFWTHSGTMPTIDGVNDYAYIVNSSTASLGTLTSSAVATAVIGWQVNADIDDGYGVYVYENQNLQNGSAQIIADVADAAVSVGVSEYGARSSDTTLAGSTFDTADTAILTSAQLVGSRSDNAFKSRDFLTLKAAINASHATGNFSHQLTFIYVGDY